MLKEVIVDQKGRADQVQFKVVLTTGAASEHWYYRRVRSYRDYGFSHRIYRRIRQLHAQGKLDEEIADGLNEGGLCGAKGCRFTGKTVCILRQHMGLPSVIPHGPFPRQWDDDSYSVYGAAKPRGVYPGTIQKRLKRGPVRGQDD